MKLPPKKSPPKYENPDFDPETDKAKDQFWTGKGRKPAWAVAYIEQNSSLDDCLINKHETVKEKEIKPAKVAAKTVKKKPVKKSK